MIPDPAVVQAMVEAAIGGSIAVGGVLAARHDRRSDDVHADNLTGRVVANAALGVPFTPNTAGTGAGPAVAGPGFARGGRACHGVLTRHEDGAETCHGGLADCHGDGSPHGHRKVVSCQDIDHGCGRCDAAKGAGVTLDPPTPEDTTCARGCGREGTVLVAAVGSLPTIVCGRCADSISQGRVLRLPGVPDAPWIRLTPGTEVTP